MKNSNNYTYLKKLLWRLSKDNRSECVHVSCVIKIGWFSCKIPQAHFGSTLTKEELTFHGGEIQDWSLNLWLLAKLHGDSNIGEVR